MMDDEKIIICREEDLTYVTILYRHSTGDTEAVYGNIRQGRR
jgi:hypothetical protein